MEYIYAVMLLNSAQKEVNEKNVTAVVKAAGIDVDLSKIKSIIASLEGVDIEKLIEENSMASVISSAQQANSPSENQPSEDKKEEKKPKIEKPSTEDSAAGLGSLF